MEDISLSMVFHTKKPTSLQLFGNKTQFLPMADMIMLEISGRVFEYWQLFVAALLWGDSLLVCILYFGDVLRHVLQYSPNFSRYWFDQRHSLHIRRFGVMFELKLCFFHIFDYFWSPLASGHRHSICLIYRPSDSVKHWSFGQELDLLFKSYSYYPDLSTSSKLFICETKDIQSPTSQIKL